jgi:hypothetical protein
VTATFVPSTVPLTVTKGGAGAGTVTSSPAGIDCGATCNFDFNAGAAITLTATPAAGSIFAGWTGACTGTAPCQVTLNAATSVNANFEIATNLPRLVGISTRMAVLTQDNVMIGGFIIDGTQPKTVVVRARGPSLGVAGALADPTMVIVPAVGGPSLLNDDWPLAANAAQLQASGFAPGDPHESALLVTLPPGAYTAIVSGKNNTTGVAIVEVFELDRPEVPLIGISTRGFVQTQDNVMIGGFIIQGSAPLTVAIRARGPSLGVTGALANPTLVVVPAAGTPSLLNDDWQLHPNAAQMQASGFAPNHPLEAGMLVTLPPGAYTAIVTGVNSTTGVALVEVYVVD